MIVVKLQGQVSCHCSLLTAHIQHCWDSFGSSVRGDSRQTLPNSLNISHSLQAHEPNWMCGFFCSCMMSSFPPLQTPRTAPPNRTYICREFTDGATYIIALHPIKLPIMLRLSFYLLHATDPDSIAALLYDTGAGIMQPTCEPNAASWLLQLETQQCSSQGVTRRSALSTNSREPLLAASLVGGVSEELHIPGDSGLLPGRVLSSNIGRFPWGCFRI